VGQCGNQTSFTHRENAIRDRSTSGSSDEITSTATPSPASEDNSRWTSAFVPTSIPRVGSSTIKSRGWRQSHFARTTFC